MSAFTVFTPISFPLVQQFVSDVMLSLAGSLLTVLFLLLL